LGRIWVPGRDCQSHVKQSSGGKGNQGAEGKRNGGVVQNRGNEKKGGGCAPEAISQHSGKANQDFENSNDTGFRTRDPPDKGGRKRGGGKGITSKRGKKESERFYALVDSVEAKARAPAVQRGHLLEEKGREEGRSPWSDRHNRCRSGKAPIAAKKSPSAGSNLAREKTQQGERPK